MLRNSRLIALCILATLLSACGDKGDPTRHPSLADGLLPRKGVVTVRERSFRLDTKGQPIGALNSRMSTLEDGSEIHVNDMRFVINRTAGDEVDRFEIEMHTTNRYDSDHRLVSTRSRTVEGGVTTTVAAAYSDRAVTVTLNGPSASFTKSYPLPAGFSDGYTEFRRLRDQFDETGKASARFKTFDEDRQAVDDGSLEFVQRLDHVHDGVVYPAYELKLRSSSLGVATVVVDRDFMAVQASLMGLFDVTWVSDASVPEAAAGGSLNALVNVKGSAPDQFRLDGLWMTISLDGEQEGDTDFLESNRYQTVRREGTNWHLELHSTRLNNGTTTPVLPIKSKDVEISRFLQSTPQSQSDDQGIRALAQKIVSDDTDSVLVVRRIVNWVYSNIEKQSGSRGAATATEVLASRMGDCTEHAALSVALCRAAGVPARIVTGIEYLVLQDDVPMAGHHAWAEAWLGRWVGIDATIPEVGTSARYIYFDLDEPGHASRSHRLIRSLTGNAQITVHAYRHHAGRRIQIR